MAGGRYLRSLDASTQPADRWAIDSLDWLSRIYPFGTLRNRRAPLVARCGASDGGPDALADTFDAAGPCCRLPGYKRRSLVFNAPATWRRGRNLDLSAKLGRLSTSLAAGLAQPHACH